MRVRIDGMVHLPKAELGAGVLERIKQELTIQPRMTSDVGKVRELLKLWKETRTEVLVPRGYYLKRRMQGHEEVVQVSSGHPMRAAVQEGGVRWVDTPPYGEQVAAVSAVLSHVCGDGGRRWGGGMLQASCAFGKTVCALRIAYALGRTTLVVVNKNFFMRQWRKEIEYFLPGARIGRIQGGECDIEGKDIVLGMIHTLAQKEMEEEVYRAFGTLIVDECHRVGADSFSTVVPKFHAAYRIGLSATPKRKDGTEASFLWNIGEVAYHATTESMIPVVKAVDGPEISCGKYSVSFDGMNSAMADTAVAMNETHNERCLTEALAAVGKGRKVMMLSTRMEQLCFFYERLRRYGKKVTIGWATGTQPLFGQGGALEYMGEELRTRATREEDLEYADSCQVILATKQMIEEGFNLQPLDTIILCVPVGDIEQTGGRIRRYCLPGEGKCERLCPWRAGVCEGKPQPVIVDVVNPHQRTLRKFEQRLEFYRSIRAKVLSNQGTVVGKYLRSLIRV